MKHWCLSSVVGPGSKQRTTIRSIVPSKSGGPQKSSGPHRMASCFWKGAKFQKQLVICHGSLMFKEGGGKAKPQSIWEHISLDMPKVALLQIPALIFHWALAQMHTQHLLQKRHLQSLPATSAWHASPSLSVLSAFAGLGSPCNLTLCKASWAAYLDWNSSWRFFFTTWCNVGSAWKSWRKLMIRLSSLPLVMGWNGRYGLCPFKSCRKVVERPPLGGSLDSIMSQRLAETWLSQKVFRGG